MSEKKVEYTTEPTPKADQADGATPAAEAAPDPLAALKTELEGERAKAAAAIKTATEPLAARISSLESSLKERESQVTHLTDDMAHALDEFKTLVIAANPLIPPDMLQGKSIAEIKTSAEKAQAFITSVKTAVQAQLDAAAQGVVVPAGAPERSENTDNLSTREKITLGLKKARK